MPAVRVCVQDDTDDAGPIGDPYCGLPIAGFADPVPPSCDRILAAWDKVSGGPMGQPRSGGTSLLPLHYPLQPPRLPAGGYGARPWRHVDPTRAGIGFIRLPAGGRFDMLKRSERGQAMVELALAAPMFMLVLVGIIVLGIGVFYEQELTNVAREAAPISGHPQRNRAMPDGVESRSGSTRPWVLLQL